MRATASALQALLPPPPTAAQHKHRHARLHTLSLRWRVMHTLPCLSVTGCPIERLSGRPGRAHWRRYRIMAGYFGSAATGCSPCKKGESCCGCEDVNSSRVVPMESPCECITGLTTPVPLAGKHCLKGCSSDSGPKSVGLKREPDARCTHSNKGCQSRFSYGCDAPSLAEA